MFRRLLLTIISGILGLWAASQFVPGVEFVGPWTTLILAGVILGLINFFIKPILKFVTLPLRLLTFGLFGVVINIAVIWIMDILFTELAIEGIIPLLLTTLIIWGLNLLTCRVS